MNLRNQPPVFVPPEYRREIEQMSKAALMDIVWDYARQIAGSEDDSAVIAEVRDRIEIILAHRERAKAEGRS